MIVQLTPPSMTGQPIANPAEPHVQASTDPSDQDPNDRILCQHCRRTASNGIRCLGMCVADSDY